MKKPEFLNKLTIIDILIIICIIGAAGFAIYHMVDDDSSKPSSTSFDYSTNPKILETYLDYYQEGNVITSTIVGTKSDTGEEVEVKSRVLWLGESENEKINILIDDNGQKLLAGFYKDVPDADIFIEEMSLEKKSETYANVTDILIAPEEINSLNELIAEIPNGTQYEISTTLALDNMDSVKYQKLLNALNKNKKPSIISKNFEKNTLEINRADKTDFKIADKILGNFNGQTSEIQIRIYNSSPNDIKAIQSSFNVLDISKTTN